MKYYMALFFFLMPGVIFAGDCIRCNGRLACVGDDRYEVYQICGEPDYRTVVQVRTAGESSAVRLGDSVCFSEWSQSETMQEKWVYDNGPTMFLRVLTFRNDELLMIEMKGKP